MEFLVHMKLRLPSDWPLERQNDIYAEEAESARRYLDSGQFAHVWREPGTRNHYAIWDVADVQTVHDAYSNFPMFPWMTVAVTPLCRNGNSPDQPAMEQPGVSMTYPVLRMMLDAAHRSGIADAMEGGLELCPGVSVHDHPGSDRGRQLHFMVDGVKVAELGPETAEGESGVGPGYVDLLQEWQGKPVRHKRWQQRILADNGLLHADYSAALAAPRARF